jgi:hypothetical protein
MNNLLKNSSKSAYICKIIDGDILVSASIDEIKTGENQSTGFFIIKNPLKISRNKLEFKIYNPFSDQRDFLFSRTHIINVSLANNIISEEYFQAILEFYGETQSTSEPRNWGLN